jgi:diguanylate cyclase (GGDEF)-like protein/PAS domain S-box-containing protein
VPWRSLAVVAGGYLAFGLLWILVSDRMAALFAPSREALSQWQTLKGAAFVVVSAAVVGALVWREAARLRASERRWRAIIEQAPVGFWLLDERGGTVRVNGYLAKLLGYAPADMAGRAPAEFVADGDRDLLSQGPAETPSDGTYELALTTRSGTTVPVLFNARVLSGETGERLGAFAFVTDLTVPAGREQALRDIRASLGHQQEFIHALLEGLPGPFFAFDDSGRMLLWNRYLKSALGFADSQVLAMTPADFFTAESLPAVQAGVADTFNRGEGTAEGVVAAPDGSEVPFRLKARRLDWQGRPLAVGLGVDIRSEKAVAASLERSNRALRTLSRANEVLVHAEDEDELLADICGVLVEEGGYHAAWVGLVAEGDPPVLRIGAMAPADGAEAADPPPLRLTAADPAGAPFAEILGRGLAARLDATGRLLGPGPEAEGESAGARQSGVFPLVNAAVHGVLVVCSREADAFGSEEWGLLQELAGELDFGLGALHARAEQARNLAELRRSAAVFEQTAEGILITDASERIVAVNEAFTRITGYSEEEVLGQTPRLLSSGVHGPDFYWSLWRDLLRNGVWQGEIWNRRKDGEVFPQRETISEVRDDDGNLVNFVAVFSDITETRKTEDELAFLTYHDPLTGLSNRSLFRERLTHALEYLGRRERPLAMINLDLQGFGTLNDSLGPDAGDAVLKAAAQRLEAGVRAGDTVCRPGGDEFWVLLEDLGHSEDAGKVVQELLAHLAEPLPMENRTLRLEANAGIALAPADGDTAEGLITNAAAALHRAQGGGGQPIQFFSKELGEQASKRLELEHALKWAIEREELRLWYQPQVDLASGRIVALEALVRWEHPEWGLVSPGEFIPVAEESGLVIPIGEWVLGEAVAQLARWRARGFAVERMAVNVAAVQLNRPGLAEHLAARLKETGLPPGCVELEITEEGFLADLEGSLRALEAIADQGARLAIDDFGTGYSSLAYLKRLPVDTLKIDKTFIDGLPADEHDRSITEAILAVARQMGLEVVAEGVETEVQAQWLDGRGIHLAQGFLWARAQPPEALEASLPRAEGRGQAEAGGSAPGRS